MRPMSHQSIGSALAPGVVRQRLCRRHGLQRRDGALPTLPKGVRALTRAKGWSLMRQGKHDTAPVARRELDARAAPAWLLARLPVCPHARAASAIVSW